MVKISNTVIGLLNICSLILSLAAIGASVYFHMHAGTQCQKVIRNPLLTLGVCLFAVSLLGFVGSCFKVNWVLYTYLGVMIALIVGIILFTGFAFLVTNGNAGKAVSGKGFSREYRVGDFSHWLKKRFADGENWQRIRSCLVDMNVCKRLSDDDGTTRSSDELFRKFTLVQLGCCKPPHHCGYVFKNSTYWEPPKSGFAVDNKDCKTWSNNQTKLCYDCESCRAGVLASIRREWRALAIFNSCVLAFLVIVCTVGCCASTNNRVEKYFFYKNRSQA